MRFDHRSANFIETTINPNKIAVVGSDSSLTWAELQLAASTLAEDLGDLPCDGTPVLIYGHKEATAVAAMVACMMRDIPYIPVDVMFPISRIEKIVAQARPSRILNVSQKPSPLILASDSEPSLSRHPPHDPIRYIIFTSGSTGVPKGVQITRSALATFADWLRTDFRFSASDTFINNAPFSFDLSVYELTGFLTLGATIVLNSSDAARSTTALLERAGTNNASIWVATPSQATMMLLDDNFNGENLPHLKTFLFCGETLLPRTARDLLAAFPGARVLNTYGPTEATVATTLVDITTDIIEQYNPLPVGRVKPGTRIEIDGDPSGGEIILIGDNVSIGYLGNDELNGQKFFSRDGKRGFRTGDTGHFVDDLLFFRGRIDNQVKLSGYRIELGEIDACVAKTPGVREVVTMPLKRDNEVKKLVCFVAAADGIDSSAKLLEDIKKNLALQVPSYMIPAEFRVVASFPYNANHKIDRDALLREHFRIG